MLFIPIISLGLFAAGLFLAPDTAEAWPGKKTNCMSCHDLEDADASIYTAIDGTDSTPVTAGDPIFVNVNAGDSFEIDWYFTNATDYGSNNGVSPYISYPDGWTIAVGSNNSPSLSGWDTLWDSTAGGSWTTAYDTSAYLPGSDGRTIEFDGTAWDTGNRDAACDSGGSCSSGTDQDGTTEEMGGDATVTVPAGTSTGMYTIMVFGIGHDSAQGGAKSHVDQIINVNVTGTPGTDDTLLVTSNTAVATTAQEGEAEIQMQRVQMDCDNVGDGNCVITSVAIDDLGSIGNGFDAVDIHIDDDTDFGNGTLGFVRDTSFRGNAIGISLSALSTAVRTVTNGTSKYIWLIYDLGTNTQGSTIESRISAINVAGPDTGATGIWDSNNITVGSAGNISPIIHVDDPNGTMDMVAVGGSYSIQYDLSDSDNVVTASFYYDSDASGYNGTAITGACATAAEGNNATCSWDTTGMTPGSYYVYGVANDGVNPDTKDYSSGQITIIASNTAPTAPADHAQYRSDGSTTITNGHSTNETTVVIKATVSDPDSHVTRLEVEILDNASSYTGTANCYSSFVTSGTVATATCSGLSNGTSYKWRARTNDNMDVSAWQTWGGADPDVTIKTAMDFGIFNAGNTAPDDPTNLAQFRSNGTSIIASGGYTEEATVKIEADISDPDGGDTVKLQVDMDGDNVSDCESALVSNPTTNQQVSCSVTADASHDWQVRTVDDKGGTSNWVAFAGSPDVISDQTAPAYTWNTPAAGTYYKDGQGISVDITITETGSGMTDGADCFASLGVADTGYTGTVNYVQASGKCTGTLTLDNPSGIADGAHDITLDAEDNVSNTQTSAARSINIDNSAPAGLSNASPADSAADQSTSVSVTANTATDSGSGSVQYYFEVAENSGFSVGLQQSGWQAGTSYAPTLANSTTYYWHVKAKDALGNETAYTTTWSFTTSTPNNAPDNPASLTQYKSNGTTVIGQGGYTDETSIIIKASVDDTDAQNVSIEGEIVLNAGSFTGTANCTGGSAVGVPGTAQVTCNGLSTPNSYKWRVRAYDGIDYSSWVTYGGNPDVNVDQTAPSYTWNTPSAGTYYADSDTISVDVTITESGIGISNGADCTPLIDGASTEFAGSVTYNDGTGKCTGTLTIDNPSALTDGSHNLTVEVADMFGNSQQSASRSINIDNTAPTYTWNTPAAGAYFSDGANISVDVSITETGEGITNGLSCNPKIDGAATAFTGTVTYNAISLKCTGTLTIDDPSSLTDGSHNLTVEVADDLGNTQQSANRSINIDNTAPTGLNNSSPADGATDVLVTSSVTSGTATDAGSGSVEYYFQVAEDSGFSAGLQQSGWQAETSYAPTLAGNTTYYWHVAATDAVGNTTAYTATWSFTTGDAANNPPAVPSGHDQYEVDGTTLIAHNGINNTSIVRIKATLSDADADTVKLEIEMINSASSYTGTPNCTSQFVTSGSIATATCGSLVDGVSYKWRARSNDGTDTSGWQTYGGSDPDVRIILSGQFNQTSCSGCHAYPPLDGSARNVPEGATLGGHAVTGHDAVAGNCNKCHVVPGATEYDHRNENIEMTATIHSQTGSSYSKGTSFTQSNSPTLGTCSSTYCHGTQSFQWGTPQLTSYDSCTICHGNAALGTDGSVSAYKRAPGADGSGVDTGGDSANTDVQVGAHQAHLTASNNISDPIACGECHTVPGAVDDAGHWDTAGARDAAELTFNGPIGDTDYAGNPLTITYSSGQCSNTYCHDGRNYKNAWSTAAQIDSDFETPTWNEPIISGNEATYGGDGNMCNNCHGYPPAGSHPSDSDCSACHIHVDPGDDGFTGAANVAKHMNRNIEAVSDCLGCHNGVPSGATYVTRDVVGSDFVQSYRHVFGGTVTEWDCVVCHREGDASAASSGTISRTSLHNNSGTIVVDLRNVDSINSGWTWDKYDGTCSNPSYDNINECVDNSATWTWNNSPDDQMHTDMDSFCMGCHDADGASGINVKATDDGVNLDNTRAMTPFNSTDDVSEGVGGGTTNIAGYERTEVLDVYTQFDPTNPSHHAVRGQAYSSHNANWGDTAWVDRTLKDGTRLITDTIYESAQLHCADCHTTDANAHGGANGFMLQASSIDDTCYLCHNSATYSNNASSDTRWNHDNDSSVWDTGDSAKIGQYGANAGSICLNCHGGDPVTDGFGGIHGLPYDAAACEASPGTGNPDCDPRSGEPRYRFQGGAYMSHSPSSWTGTSGSTPTCYFDASSKNQPWSNCGQHNGTEAGRTQSPQYSRGVPGDY